MEEKIRAYLKTKQNSWAVTTIKSTGAGLLALAPVLNGNPEHLWEFLQPLKPYSRLTRWTQVCNFWSWNNEGKTNPYEKWRKENQNFFKNVYRKERVGFGYQEALQKIEEIGDSEVRRLALSIVQSGQRFSESQQPFGKGYITGKGGKIRPDLRDPSKLPPDMALSDASKHELRCIKYDRFYRQLRSVGIKPHQLRKIAITHAAENGAQAADLCEIAGWSSISTAFYYLQPQQNSKLRGFLSHEPIKVLK